MRPVPSRTSPDAPATAARRAAAPKAAKVPKAPKVAGAPKAARAPAKAAPLSRDELTAVAREAVRALPGLRAADLKKKLPKPLQSQHVEVLEALRGLSASGEIFRHVTPKAERFFAVDPIATLDGIVPEILARGEPMAPAALKKTVAEAAPAEADLFEEWLGMAIARRLVFAHGTAAKGAPKRVGSAPDLAGLLAKTFVELRKVLPAIDGAGVPLERVLEAIRKEIGLAGAPSPTAPTPARPPAPPSDHDVVRAALARLASEDRPGTLLLVKHLRARTPLDKERFDAAALALSREGAAVLHHHDSPAALTEDERRLLVADGRGTYYVGIAPRSNA